MKPGPKLRLMNVADTTIKTKGIDNLSFKIGRQALIYDDVRLLGDLDWLQQARRHDALLVKALHHGWQVDLGAGFNQNSDAFGITGTNYTAGNVPAYVTNSAGALVANTFWSFTTGAQWFSCCRQQQSRCTGAKQYC